MIYNNELKVVADDRTFTNLLAADIFDRLGGQETQLLAKCVDFDPMSASRTEKLLTTKFVKSEDKKVRTNLFALLLFLHTRYDGNPDLANFQKFSAMFAKVFGEPAFKAIHTKTAEAFKSKVEKAKTILKPVDKTKKKKDKKK